MYQYIPDSIYGLCLPVAKPDPEPGYDANGSPVDDQPRETNNDCNA